MRRQVSPPSAADTRIARVGADGDGIGALTDGTPVYIPLTLPGELVRARPLAVRGEGWAAGAEAVLEPSVARVTAPCRHFGECGGCTLQHWRGDDYLAWKRELLVAALRRAGFDDAEVAPMVATPPRVRRRMDLAVRPGAVGLHKMRSNEIVDLQDCQILHPDLMRLIAPLRETLGALQAIRREASVIANLLDGGADLLLRSDAEPSLADRIALTNFARAHGLPRISWAKGNGVPETICRLRQPTIALSGIAVTPPPGAFLQASAPAETAIIEAVLAAIPAKARVAELYCGCGTLSFALAAIARVTAWDNDAGSVAALRQAANQTGLAGRINATPRDLTRQPLSVKELAAFNAVVLDPPYAGAAAQMPTLAAAKTPVVIYISCNPAALARDARVLRDAGYTLASATPIDQFLWSAQLESVCVFHAPGVGHGKPRFSRSVAPL